MAERTCDVVVIGAGPTGENVADRAVKGGLSAILVEAERLGGECSFWACIPSKAMLRPPAALESARAVAGAREAVTGSLDAAAVFGRRDTFVHHWDDASQYDWATGTGIEVIRGHGRLAGERRVAVTGADGTVTGLEARQAVAVCTGTTAAIPPIPGLAEAKPWISRDATSSHQAPRRLAIIGGGVVGCEMATAWSSLGCEEVTILQKDTRLVPALEPFASDLLRAGLEAKGVRVVTEAMVASVSRHTGGGPATISVSKPAETLEVDEILVAAGRSPVTSDIGLETVGLEPGSWLAVDETMRVPTVAGGWLYAAGDVNHRALLTHMGKYQGRVCGDVIVARSEGDPVDGPAAWSRFAATADHSCVPQVIFSSPEVGAVGFSEAEATRRGLRVRGVGYDIGKVAGASLFADGYRGRAKMVVDEDRKVIVGFTMVGMGVGEMVHAATIAIAGEVPLDRLWHAVPSYPTMSELWLRLLESYGQ
ncbi:MAG TPA: NAD(P)/FAD-dependent oxidoreductase [Actinomycetota bacterium]|nr:NAD(P)/FAD-dependent oxidoreductase [Actinomycetota bacterium]